MKKKIGITVVVLAVIAIGVSVGYFKINQMNEDINSRYSKVLDICDCLILSESAYDDYQDKLSNLKSNLNGYFAFKSNDILEEIEIEIDTELNKSVKTLKDLEQEYNESYTALSSKEYVISPDYIVNMDTQKSEYNELVKKGIYKEAYISINKMIKNMKNTIDEAKKQARIEAETLSYEEFVNELGATEEDAPKSLYQLYTIDIKDGFEPDEALENQRTYMNDCRAIAEKLRVEEEARRKEQAQKEEAQRQATIDSSQNTDNQQANTTPSQESQANYYEEDEYILSDEEAKALREKLNGGSGVQSGLTEEEREKELEAWSGIEGY